MTVSVNFPDALIQNSARPLLDQLPTAVYLCDAQGRILYFNTAAAELWGRRPNINDPRELFCGSQRMYSTDGIPLAHSECGMAKALRGGGGEGGCEILIERPDGNRRLVLSHLSLLHDDSGQVAGAWNTLVDVTNRKSIDDAQNLLVAVVESSDDAIIAKTLDSKVMSWNTGAERLFGYKPEEMIGQPITRLIPPERHAEETLIISRMKRGERIENYETVRLTKDGRLVDVSLTVSPVRDHTGRVVAASKIARDISIRKRANDAVIELKNQLEQQLADLRRLHEMSKQLSTSLELQPILEETLRMAVAIDAADCGLIALYDADHQQLRTGAVLGFEEPFLSLITEIPDRCGASRQCLKERRRVIIEDIEADPQCADLREEGQAANIAAIHSTPLITRTGEILGVLSTYFHRPHLSTQRECNLLDLCARQAGDFIENALLYERLCDADRRKDEFLAMLAHELRNPLAPLCNSLHILKMSEDLPPDVASIRDVMDQQVNHMVRLVDDLLEVSRITSGKIELRKDRIKLADVLSAAVATSRPIIEAAGHQLSISLPKQPLFLHADPVRVTQVISNLLTNAAKYTERGGQICLTVREDQGRVAISIKDNGMGIPADMLVHVFDMFAQVNRTLIASQGGLGIGLTLARQLVELHGGSIAAYSDGPGQGSEFVITLPLVEAGVPRHTLTPTKPVAVSDISRQRILVVDDTRTAAHMLAKLLEHLGQDVTAVDSAAAALDTLQESTFDVVISDVAMPGMDGYEFARRVRRDPRASNLFLVALTGFGQDSDRQRSREAGFDDHIVKPVGVDILRNLIGKLPARQESPSP